MAKPKPVKAKIVPRKSPTASTKVEKRLVKANKPKQKPKVIKAKPVKAPVKTKTPAKAPAKAPAKSPKVIDKLPEKTPAPVPPPPPPKIDKKKLLKKINSYTMKLNSLTLPEDERTRLRTKRRNWVNQILPLVSDNEAVFLLPFCQSNVMVSKKVALVGNAAEVLDKEQGPEIDQYTTVIRFNSGVTEGYEKHVGTKTTHLFCTKDYYNNKRKRVAGDGQVCKIKIDMTKLRNLTVVGIIIDSTKLKALHDKNQFHKSIKRSAYFNNLTYQNQAVANLTPKLNNNLKFTAGLAVLISLVDLGLKPDLYGFTHTLDPKYRTYYWPEIVRDKRVNKSHNFAKEYQVLSYFKIKNLMTFHE